jgi:hypothetical protein
MLYLIIVPASKIVISSIFVYKYLEFNYPEKVEDFKTRYLYKIAWRAVKAETYVKNYINKLKPKVYNYIYPTPAPVHKYAIVKDGLIKYQYEPILEKEFDFIILYTNDVMTRINDVTSLKEITDDYKPELSSVRFLSAEVSVDTGESVRKFNIEVDNNSIYVVGNILFDKYYIRWYVVENYGVDIVTDYTVNIIDDSINILTLTNENKIVLHKNNYEIEYI